MPAAPHPFSRFVRLLGRGKTLSRALTLDEADEAMGMILAGEVLPEQLGAFLMLLRMKEETGEEIAGFTRAARRRLPAFEGPRVDLDWPSYAGKKRQLPWFLLATLLLAQSGWRVAMHGLDGHTEGRLYAGETLKRLGVPLARNLEEARAHLDQSNFAYISLADIDPKLGEMMLLKPVLGLRSAINTLVRGLNPFGAAASLQGVFHPGYVDIHRDAALRLGDDRIGIFRGDGGESERRPNKACETLEVVGGAVVETRWPPMSVSREAADESMDIERLVALWRGASDEYGEGAVIGTVAIALKTMGVENDAEAALARARALWEARDRARSFAPVVAEVADLGGRGQRPRLQMGEVYLVGAGPGDPDLLTFRAMRLIRQAEVVLYDRLVDPAILDLVPAEAERVFVGKRPNHHAAPQEEISRLLVEYARQGKRVLRLKGGDPFIFGRGGEEIETLAEQGVPFQVCPGVTAAIGCSAYSGIPLTHRDHAQACVFVTAHGKDGPIDRDWTALVRPGQTVAIYMGLGHIEETMATFIAQGVDPKTPAAIVDNGARANQRVVVADVETLASAARAAALRGPTIIIVGSVVTLREKLNWRDGDAARDSGAKAP